MNKRINSLSWSGLLGIEKKEHGLKSKPSFKDLPMMEMKEHGLKSPPTKAQIIKMEKKEHVKNHRRRVGFAITA
jgi:hypothetical protein